MPNTFKNAKQLSSISLADVYTCPSNNAKGTVDSAVVVLIQAANVTARADTVTVVWTDASDANKATRLGYTIPVPAMQSVGLLTGKLVLEPGDKIRAQCATHQAIEISVSVLETS